MIEAGSQGAGLQEAMERHRRGDLATARRLYLAYLDRSPDDVEAMCLLAALEGQAGDHAGAEAAYRKAIAGNDMHGPAWAGLGASLLLQNRPDAAVEPLSRAVDLLRDEPEIRLQLTLALQRHGRLREAREVLEALLERWPSHLLGRHNLGLLLLQSGDPDGAAAQFRAVLQEETDRFGSWIALGRALMAANDPAGAEKALACARELRPADPEPRILLGNLLRGLGRFGEAKSQFEEVLAARPGDDAATMGLAELDLAEGKPARGLERLAPRLDAPVPPRGAARLAARLLIADDRQREAVQSIEKWLETPGLSTLEKAGLFSLKGRALDRLGRQDEAWQAWTESHRQRPSRFDGRHFSSAIDRLVAAYDESLFAEHASHTRNRDGGAVLVVGTPRSGKSILEQILACHPAIRGAGELRYLGAMTNEVARRVAHRERPYPDCIRDLSDQDLNELGESYQQAMDNLAEDARWVVDTQPTNFLHIGLAALLQPNIRVILCRRDHLDTAWACYSTHFADPGLDFVSSPEGIACYLDGMGRLMRHWETVSPANIREVRYEQLVRSPREALQPVLETLGLDWDDGMMEYAEPGRSGLVRAPAITRRLNESEIGRGAPYRDRFPEIRRLPADEDHDG